MAQGAASVSGKRLFRARFVPRTDGRRRGGDAGSDSLVVAAGVVPCRGWQPRFYSAGAGLAVPPGRCRTWSHNCGVSGTTVYAWEPAAMPRPYNERFVPQESHRARQQTSRGSRPEYRPTRLPASRPAARGHGQDLSGGVRGRRAPARAGAVDPCPVGRDRTACRSHAMAGPAAARGMDAGGDGARDAGARRGPLAHCLCPAAVLPAGIPPGAARSDGQPIVARVDRARRRPAVVVRRARPGGAVDGGAAGRTGVVAGTAPGLARPRRPTPGKNLPGAAGEPGRPSRAGGVGALRGGRPRGPWHGCFSPNWE